MSLKTDQSNTSQDISILMYHSIATASGPTSIPLETFKAQINILAECGYRAISLAAFRCWHSGGAVLDSRSVVITFDDGFADFAEKAFPVLRDQHFTATVFLPSGKIGKTEDWGQAGPTGHRRLMNWSQIEELARESIDFGGHGVTHRNLTELSAGELEFEIRNCRDQIEQALGRAPISFAPPYGRCGPRESAEIAKWFAMSLGTRLARANRSCDLYDIPRIEMHYFRDPKRWRGYLEGRAESYFAARRALRNLRALMQA